MRVRVFPAPDRGPSGHHGTESAWQEANDERSETAGLHGQAGHRHGWCGPDGQCRSRRRTRPVPRDGGQRADHARGARRTTPVATRGCFASGSVPRPPPATSSTRKAASDCRPSRPWRLADEDSPVFVAGGASVLASDVHRQGQDRSLPCAAMAPLVGRSPPLLASRHRALLPAGLPGAPGGRVAAGARRASCRGSKLGAKVADVGCGHGASTVDPGAGLSEVDASTASTSMARRSRTAHRACREAGVATACVVHAGDAPRSSRRQRLRPHLLLRLPARHGRSRRRGAACASRP